MFWRRDPRKPEVRRLPVEVVAAIECAFVTLRETPDPETGAPRALVQLAGGAPFYFDGLREAAGRLARRFSLEPQEAALAAELLAFTVAKERREAKRASKETARRYSVCDW